METWRTVAGGSGRGKIVWRGRGSKEAKDNRERNQQMRKTSASTKTAVREVSKPDGQWREELTPLQYSVLRHAHTERPFTGEYVHNHEDGFYRCAGCGSVLFSSDAKFDSGTGWPSFDEPAVAEAVELRPDNSLFMRRTEVVCRSCGGHLGHVFDDGPTATGDRYCINSCSLAFEPATSDK
jgi:peptide-methionine (R)-S-oxide reductase